MECNWHPVGGGQDTAKRPTTHRTGLVQNVSTETDQSWSKCLLFLWVLYYISHQGKKLLVSLEKIFLKCSKSRNSIFIHIAEILDFAIVELKTKSFVLRTKELSSLNSSWLSTSN